VRVQLTRPLLGIVAAAVLAAPVSAGEVEDQGLTYNFRNFADSDHIHVVSHFGRYRLGLAGGATFFLQLDHETVTVPGISAQPGSQAAVDAITSASRPISGAGDPYRDYTKTRNEVQAEIGNERVTGGYYVSKESDYFAQQVRGGVNRDFLDRNLNLAVGTSYGWDRIDPLQDDDTSTGPASRTTLSGNAAATQIVTPTLSVRFGGELNLVRGLQHNPYRNVYAGGTRVPERHPDERLRQEAFVKVSQYLLNRSSLKATYQLYHDDWGVSAHTVTGQLNQYVTDKVIVRYKYRFHTQSAAYFHRSEYDDVSGFDGYRTGDYRLEAMKAHLFGAGIDVNLGAVSDRSNVLRRLELQIDYERYFNSNNFSANILESGLVYAF
jgi:Protein of unknown function (DUF3570)